MKAWSETRLGRLIRIKHGFAFKGEHFSDRGHYILLTPGNVYPTGGLKLKGDKETFYTGDIPRGYVLDRGDLVVIMTDLTQDASILGGVLMIDTPERYLHNQRLGLVSHSDEMFRRFLYHYFNWQFFRDQVKASSNGATVKHTSPGRIYQCRMFRPPVPIQVNIAAVLSAYDELIDNNTRRIELLEQLAEDTYREWFVRLRFPGHEKIKHVKGMPDTWEQTRFGKFCMLKRGYDLPDKDVEPGDYPVMASTTIKTYHNAFKAKPPVITTGRSGSLGTVLMVNCNAWPLNTALYVKDFFGNSPYFVFYTLKGMKLENFNSGAGVPTLNRNHINGIKMAVPDKDLQNRFDSVVRPIHDLKDQLLRANTLLAQTREALRPWLLSGKLSVENLDIRFFPRMAEEVTAMPDATTHA